MLQVTESAAQRIRALMRERGGLERVPRVILRGFG